MRLHPEYNEGRTITYLHSLEKGMACRLSNQEKMLRRQNIYYIITIDIHAYSWCNVKRTICL